MVAAFVFVGWVAGSTMPSKPGQRKRRPLAWDETKKRALDLVFEGRKSLEKIALDCAVSARTLDDWIAHPDFQAKLQERRDSLIASLDHVPYVRKERRIIGLAQMAEDARQQYEAHPWLREFRPLPQKSAVRIRSKGPDGVEEVEVTEPLDAIVNEAFNEAAFNAFRGALDDIAKELGARKNVTELSGALDLNERVLFVLPERDEEIHDPLSPADAANP